MKNNLNISNWRAKLYHSLIFISLLIFFAMPFISAAEMDYISSFSTSASGAINVYGICAANEKLYMENQNDDKVYVFWQNGTYTGTSWSITADSRGLACNSSTIWIQDPTGTDDVTEYLENGTATGRSFSTSEVNDGLGLAFDGTYFYAGDETGNEIYKYWANGSYTGTTFTPNNSMGGLTTYENYLYINFGWNTVSSVKKMFKNGTYVSAWNRHVDNANYGGIAMNGSRIWVADIVDDMIYVYEGQSSAPPSDTVPPYFKDGTPVNQTLIYNTALNYQINASDETGLSCFTVNDTNFKINCSGYLQNNTVLGVAIYNLNIIINDTSNNLNYTLMWVNVTKASQSITPLLNGLNANLSITYPQQFNASYSGTNQTAATLRNSIVLVNGQNYSWGAGSWIINYSMQPNQNYSGFETNLNLTTNQANSLVYAYINNSRADFTTESGASNLNISLNGSLVIGNGNIELWLNNSLINNGTSPISNSTNLSLGVYNLTTIYYGNQNYSGSNEVYWITIVEAGSISHYSSGGGGTAPNEPIEQNSSLNLSILKNATFSEKVQVAIKEVRDGPMSSWSGFTTAGVIIVIFMILGIFLDKRRKR